MATNTGLYPTCKVRALRFGQLAKCTVFFSTSHFAAQAIEPVEAINLDVITVKATIAHIVKTFDQQNAIPSKLSLLAESSRFCFWCLRQSTLQNKNVGQVLLYELG